MFKFKTRAYHLLIITAILLLAVSFFGLSKTVELHFYDTYYIISTAHASWAMVLLLSLLWLAYVFTSRWLYSKALVWLHVLLTIATTVFVFIYVFNFREPAAAMPRHYADYSDRDFFWRYEQSIIVSAILFVFGVVLYGLNLVIGLISRRPNSGNRRM